MDDAPLLMEHAVLERILSAAYQASLLRDEDRPVRLRLIVADPGAFSLHAGPPEGLHPLAFERPLPFSAQELRRLAAAAKYQRALIGVRECEGGELGIWGIIQSGPGWLQVAQGGRATAPSLPPAALVVRVLGPGRLAVDRGGLTLAELRGGEVTLPSFDVFRSRWLLTRFNAARGELMAKHAEARALAAEPWAALDPDLTRLISQQMVKRFIATMRAAHHGGTVLLLPPSSVGEALTEGRYLRLKYVFRDEPPRRRYRALMLAMMEELARAGGAAGASRVGFRAYQAMRSPAVEALDDAIFEMSQLIASLSEVDGAVVMSKRFEIIGFGAEIAGDLPDVRVVARALDLEATEREDEAPDAVGTRHRSAYRLCAKVEEAVAVVVSQDGTVRFIAHHEGRVTYWDHAPTDAPDV
jgi:hypothetical protein